MEAEVDSRFDPQVASSLLLEIGQEQSLDQLLRKLVNRILERPGVARVRIWLIDKGDICATCVRRSECPDQTRCLHAGYRQSVSDPCRDLKAGCSHRAQPRRPPNR
jgi:hypothetical protein